jgi:3-oxoacyl-[acyl-carrier protein] reductase
MAVSLDVSGKIALVTGGSRGIGAACVRLFTQAGAKVAFNYQHARKQAEDLVRECGHDQTFGIQASLDSPGDGRELIAAAIDRFGALDILVANHGIWPPEDVPVDQMTTEQWDKTVAVNLDSVFGLIRTAVKQFKKEQRGGHIVLISSTAGQRGEAFHCDYAATKGAIISMVKGLATELAREHIYVNCVAPGWVQTDMTRDVLAQPATGEKVRNTIPLGRVGKPEEIAASVLFLCTPHAGFITGEVLNVNGGAVLVG